jgi:D-3-phosphoglycerate dehydrogenase
MKQKVFVPEPIDRSGLDLLKGEFDCLVPWDSQYASSSIAQSGKANSLEDALLEADAVIVRLFKITEQELQKATRLKVIAKHGTGFDNIDCKAATMRHIPVIYTPAANSNAVAEYTVALMLSLSRHICAAYTALIEGHFDERGKYKGVELAGKTLAVIGLGRIGSQVALKAALGLNMIVYAYDPLIPPEKYSGPAILIDSLEEVLKKADYLTLHVPLTPDTNKMINAQSLNLLRPGCRIINTSRGAVIDEDALITALNDGTIAGAALDVFQEEPLPKDHPLCHAPNVLLTPHISSSTRESLELMSLQAAQGILDVFRGKQPEYIVNPEALD